MSLVHATQELARALAGLRFTPPVACVYNPLDYAWDLHRAWLERFGRGEKEVLLVGMNPGPFGMVQTGVPFGEVEAVRSWLRLRGQVRRPAVEHPKRPVLGLECTRSEVSGRRLWGWAAARFVTPQRFLRRFFVHNYCPLAFVSETGANLTPDKLVAAERKRLEDICDDALADTLAILSPRHVVGIGQYAAKRAALVTGADVITMPHPSPASPSANRGWETAARAALTSAGLGHLL
jgi:single-strand selective monofunctional uracil DNA glycosylase